MGFLINAQQAHYEVSYSFSSLVKYTDSVILLLLLHDFLLQENIWGGEGEGFVQRALNWARSGGALPTMF